MEYFKYDKSNVRLVRRRLSYQIGEPEPGPIQNERIYVTENYTQGERQKYWYKKVARGSNATTNFVGGKQKISSSNGLHVYEFETTPTNHLYREYSGDILYTIGLPALPASSTIDQAENIAREKFYSEYRRQVTSFQGLTVMGELRESIRMFKSPARALRERIRRYHDNHIARAMRLSRKSIRSANSYLRGTWLEASFGWAPLISNISDAANAVEDQKYRLNRELIQIKTEGSVKEEVYNPNAVNSGSGGIGFIYGTRTEYKTFVTYRGAIRLGEQSPYNSKYATWGFDPSQIIPTVWELIPYSFLIDYFTNVGKFIDAASLRRPELAWGARTEGRIGIVQSVDFRSNNTYYPDNPLFKIYAEANSPSVYRGENKTIARSPIGTVSMPDLRFRLPRTTTQWLNIAALNRVKRQSLKRGFNKLLNKVSTL